MKKGLIAIMLILALGITGLLFAEDAKPEKRVRRGFRPAVARRARSLDVRLYSQLKLTAEQKEKLAVVRKELQEKIKAAVAEAKKKSEDVLTAEQKEKLVELKAAQKKRMEDVRKKLEERRKKTRPSMRPRRPRRKSKKDDAVVGKGV